MENTSKDYSCKNDDCSMTFTSEDLLLAHVKRHEMVLNLGAIKGNLFNADQTPTPTRFIRNCDEVGLFQDLQNVNPFDETFKRAVEQAKNGITNLTTPVSNIILNDDTLHTPHIFPTFSSIGDSTFHINKEQNIEVNTNDNDETDENVNGSETPFKKRKLVEHAKCESANISSDEDSVAKIQESNSLNEAESISSDNIDSIKAYNETSLVINVHLQPDKEKNCTTNHLTSVSNESKILLPVFEQIEIHEKFTNQAISNTQIKLCSLQKPETKTNVKEHLKQSLLRNSKTPSITKSSYLPSAGTLHKVHKITPVIITNAIPIVTPAEKDGLCIISPKILPDAVKIPQKEKTTQRTVIKQKPQVLQCTNDEQREEFLARGRAAASRWRFKKKEQIKELITRNQQLENENSFLRSECAQLKKLLLTHKDCIIAQNSTIGQQVIISSDVIIPKNVKYDNIKRKTKKVPKDTIVTNKSDNVR